jgi:8-oxo-dGTP pyrophosphatase MutT (NUDIX family)
MGLPKGHKKCETNYECAVRELYEETGIRILKKPINTKNVRICKGHYFRMQLSNEIIPHPVNDFEIEEAKWFEIEDIKSLDGNQTIKRWGANQELRMKYAAGQLELNILDELPSSDGYILDGSESITTT